MLLSRHEWNYILVVIELVNYFILIRKSVVIVEKDINGRTKCLQRGMDKIKTFQLTFLRINDHYIILWQLMISSLLKPWGKAQIWSQGTVGSPITRGLCFH